MVYGDGWCMYLIIHMNIIGKATSNTHYEIHLLLTNDKQQDDDILSYMWCMIFEKDIYKKFLLLEKDKYKCLIKIYTHT